jgi:hypothetical protein
MVVENAHQEPEVSEFNPPPNTVLGLMKKYGVLNRKDGTGYEYYDVSIPKGYYVINGNIVKDPKIMDGSYDGVYLGGEVHTLKPIETVGAPTTIVEYVNNSFLIHADTWKYGPYSPDAINGGNGNIYEFYRIKDDQVHHLDDPEYCIQHYGELKEKGGTSMIMIGGGRRRRRHTRHIKKRRRTRRRHTRRRH